MPFRDLLRILEGYVVQVPFKGGHIPFRPSVVFITSDRHYTSWAFKRSKEDRERFFLSQKETEQFTRRIDLCEHVRQGQAALSRPLTIARPAPISGEMAQSRPNTIEGPRLVQSELAPGQAQPPGNNDLVPLTIDEDLAQILYSTSLQDQRPEEHPLLNQPELYSPASVRRRATSWEPQDPQAGASNNTGL